MVAPHKIVVDEIEFMWTRRHGYQGSPGSEKLTVWRADKTGGRLLVRFVDGQGGVTTAGGGWAGYDGGLLLGGRSYNLNRPGVVAALIQQALREGWDSSAKGEREVDGFALLTCGPGSRVHWGGAQGTCANPTNFWTRRPQASTT